MDYDKGEIKPIVTLSDIVEELKNLGLTDDEAYDLVFEEGLIDIFE